MYGLNAIAFALFIGINVLSHWLCKCPERIRVQDFALLLDVPEVPLPPNADRPFFLSWYCQTGKIIVAPQFVP